MNQLFTNDKLGNLVSIYGGKRLPAGRKLLSCKTKHPYIRIKDINEKQIIEVNDNFFYIDEDTHKTISRYIVKKGDIIISIVGTIGMLGIVGQSLDLANLTENCVRLTNFKNLNSKYLYYYLLSKFGQLEIAKGTVGAVQKKLPIKNIKDINIKLPNTKIQHNIAQYLSYLDDKININNKIIDNINNQICALYNLYFVSGFNHDMTSRNIGEVLTNVVKRVGNGNYPVFSAVHDSSLKLSENVFSKQVFSKNTSKYLIVEQNMFAYNPARINIGSIGINDYDFIGCVSPVYVVFMTEKGYHPFFNCYIKTDKFKREVQRRSSGSVRQTLSFKDLSLIKIHYPNRSLVNKFNNIYFPLSKSIKYIQKENENLSTIRDTLLPRLMSGELDVSELDI